MVSQSILEIVDQHAPVTVPTQAYFLYTFFFLFLKKCPLPNQALLSKKVRRLRVLQGINYIYDPIPLSSQNDGPRLKERSFPRFIPQLPLKTKTDHSAIIIFPVIHQQKNKISSGISLQDRQHTRHQEKQANIKHWFCHGYFCRSYIKIQNMK